MARQPRAMLHVFALLAACGLPVLSAPTPQRASLETSQTVGGTDRISAAAPDRPVRGRISEADATSVSGALRSALDSLPARTLTTDCQPARWPLYFPEPARPGAIYPGPAAPARAPPERS